VGISEGKRPPVRTRHKLEDNIKMDLNGLGWEGQDWIDQAQTVKTLWALVNAEMSFWVQ
jgi:hypothetical protein